jgi:hypothetical protein
LRRWLLFLARTVFHRPVSELIGSLTADDLLEWQAEFALDPWGEFRAEVAAAKTTAMVGNAFGGKKHGGLFVPAEFLFRSKIEPPKRKTWKEQMMALRGLAIRMHGVVKDRNGEIIIDARRGRRRGK